jgi:YVTN family beta-propeller protein
MKTTTRPDRASLAKRFIAGLVCWASALLLADDAQSAFGDILAQYSFRASSLVMSPSQPLMYATIPSQNSIAIINTNTLAVESTVFVGSGPANLAFSPDGLKAYIANSASNFVVVFDTQTRTVVNSFLLPEQPQDVVFGSLNRLFVLGQENIFQIDATTGASAGPNIGEWYIVYGGALEISPDRNALYYCDYGLSPAKMYKFNVSTPNATLLWQSPHGPHGSNGQDLTLSHNGSFICFATGSGQNGYQIAKFRTSDMAILGSFNTGPYPRQVAFSPDDRVVYAVHTEGEIDLFNAYTFQSLGGIFASGEASELTVDWTGRHLFAGYTDPTWGFTGTRVFDTGRIIPSPTDFNLDGKPDYVLYNASTRQTVVWYLNNNMRIGGAYGPTLPVGWVVADVADFNRDGRPDYTLFNASTCQTGIWYLSGVNGVTFIGSAWGPTLLAGWTLVATGDFNNDGKPDFVLYNASTRQTAVWYLNNNMHIGAAYGPSIPAPWSLAGIADFNVDRKPDYLLFNPSTHNSVIWYLSGTTRIGSAFGPTIAAGYTLTGTADFNREVKPDYALFNASTRQSLIWYLNNNVYVSGASGPTLPAGWSLVNP